MIRSSIARLTRPRTLPLLTAVSAVLVTLSHLNAAVVHFENFSLPPESAYNGSDGAGEFVSVGATFVNEYDSSFGSWSGFAYSNVTDNVTGGFLNQYSAFPGHGATGSANYAVGYASFPPFGILPRIEFREAVQLESVMLTNSTYAALSMQTGDAFAKRFGGPSGNDPDFFKLSMVGFDAEEQLIGEVDFYLADYRFADNSLDYIVDDWQTVDLSSLQGVTAIEFRLQTSDVGPFGPNTPFYFALDELRYFGGPPVFPQAAPLEPRPTSPIPEPELSLGLLAWMGLLMRRRLPVAPAGNRRRIC